MFQAGTEVGKVATKVEVMLERGDVDGDGDRAGADKGGADEEEDVLEMD